MQEPVPDPELQDNYYMRRPSDLRPLRSLRDWQIAEGEPDIVGWVVYNDDNTRPLGRVDDLLVSIEMAEAVFIILDTGDVIGEVGVDYYGSDARLTDRQILVPLDVTELDEPDCRVLFTGSLDLLRNAPPYGSGTSDFARYYDYWQSA